MSRLSVTLIDSSESMCRAWQNCLGELREIQRSASGFFGPELPDLAVHHGLFDRPAPGPNLTRFDAVVSPGNSFGSFGGGFDLSLARFFAPNGKPATITDSAVQHVISRDPLRGYNPVGNAFVLDMPSAFAELGIFSADSRAERLGCRYLVHLPTMRTPTAFGSHLTDTELVSTVFDFVWSVLTAIERHNRAENKPERVVGHVVIPGLGTGVGGVPVALAAFAMIAAVALRYVADPLLRHQALLRVMKGRARSLNSVFTGIEEAQLEL